MIDFQAYQELKAQADRNQKAFVNNDSDFLMKERKPMSFHTDNKPVTGDVNNPTTWQLV